MDATVAIYWAGSWYVACALVSRHKRILLTARHDVRILAPPCSPHPPHPPPTYTAGAPRTKSAHVFADRLLW